jgi:hypothetical protein
VTLEMRGTAGPSSVVQCVLSGGPYTVSSHGQHFQVVWPLPLPEVSLITHASLTGAERVPVRTARGRLDDPLPVRGLHEVKDCHEVIVQVEYAKAMVAQPRRSVARRAIRTSYGGNRGRTHPGSARRSRLAPSGWSVTEAALPHDPQGRAKYPLRLDNNAVRTNVKTAPAASKGQR